MADASSAIEALKAHGYEVRFLSHALAILSVDFPDALGELAEVLTGLAIPIEEIIGSGGGETKGTQRLRRGLAEKKWVKKNFRIDKRINDVPRESISHEVDHVRDVVTADGETSTIALEIEWNNKDPFFDRDLENFKRLHAEGAISVGIIVTRGSTLQTSMLDLVRRWADREGIDSHEMLAAVGVEQTSRQKREVLKRVNRLVNPVPFRDAWTSHFVADKFGMATTHWSKLEDRVSRGVGNPCPLLLIGIPDSVVRFDEDPAIVQALIEAGAEALEE